MPAAGSVRTTLPAGAVALYSRADPDLVGVRPASRTACSAAATGVPTATAGTWGRPLETVSRTALPRSSRAPGAGSTADTSPAATSSSRATLTVATRSAASSSRSAAARSTPTTVGMLVQRPSASHQPAAPTSSPSTATTETQAPNTLRLRRRSRAGSVAGGGRGAPTAAQAASSRGSARVPRGPGMPGSRCGAAVVVAWPVSTGSGRAGGTGGGAGVIRARSTTRHSAARNAPASTGRTAGSRRVARTIRSSSSGGTSAARDDGGGTSSLTCR